MAEAFRHLSTTPISGACLCGEVGYEAAAGIAVSAWFCHCRHCRKAGGGASATWVGIPAETFRWTRGQPRAYYSSPGFSRHFCSDCGGLLPAIDETRQRALLPAGGLDGGPPVAPTHHTYVADRADWDRIIDDLPRFAKSAEIAPLVADGEHRDTCDTGPARGSCLCGQVRWELAGEPQVMRCCHCTRCQRNSGTACFVGLPGSAEQLSIITGAEHIASYHLPGTRYYYNRFCKHCGSPVPTVLPGIPVTVASAGTLDNNPGLHIGYHLFAASRAAWYRIDPSLPAFDAYPPKDFVPN